MDATQTQLEQLVDAHGLADVLGMLMEICHGKAEHLESTWQDKPAARQWTQCAVVLDHATERVLTIQT